MNWIYLHKLHWYVIKDHNENKSETLHKDLHKYINIIQIFIYRMNLKRVPEYNYATMMIYKFLNKNKMRNKLFT